MIDREMLEAIGELLAPIIKEQREIREDLQAVMEDTARLVVLEKKVDALAEGQKGINEKFAKLDQVAEDVEEIKVKVTALENVTKNNTAQIKDIRIAK